MAHMARQHRAAAGLRNIAHQHALPAILFLSLGGELLDQIDQLGMAPRAVARQPHRLPRRAIDGKRHAAPAIQPREYEPMARACRSDGPLTFPNSFLAGMIARPSAALATPSGAILCGWPLASSDVSAPGTSSDLFSLSPLEAPFPEPAGAASEPAGASAADCAGGVGGVLSAIWCRRETSNHAGPEQISAASSLPEPWAQPRLPQQQVPAKAPV